MPRPTKCTPELTEKICEYLASGCYACTACQLVGIGTTTLQEWQVKGAAGEEPYASFTAAIKEAEAKAEARAVALVQKAMVDDWKAAMTWMERKFPDRWSRGERREHTGPGGGPVQVVPIFAPEDPLNHINDDNTGDEEDDEASEAAADATE